MKPHKFLIVGSAMTGDAAVRGIREPYSDGSIGMISGETDMPYARPLLSKGMWKGRPFDYLEDGRVRGALLWNVWEKLKEATALMAEPSPFKTAELKKPITARMSMANLLVGREQIQ